MPEFFMSKYKKDENSYIVKGLKLIEKMSLKFADDVITINELARLLFNQRSIPNEKITVVMNTVDDLIVPKKTNINDSSLNFVYHGYLAPMYGLDIAIEAFKLFIKENNIFKFYIFGDGPGKELLENLVAKYGLNNHVFLMGSVPHSKMIHYLSYMDVGILPIRKDIFTDLSFSNKLAEYIYLKIPVISSNLETTKYYFSEEEITYFNSEDPFDLKDQISFAYNNPQIMKEKAAKSIEKYKSIKWSVMKKRYLDLVASLHA
jgi:glycosyltransferase involved in cell wall biosynthesis